jgi:hypothetical protein
MPYGDLIARSAVIPVKHTLTIVVASDYRRDAVRPNTVDAELAGWADAWEAQGHTVHWLAPQNWRQVAETIVWYLRHGHNEADALIANRSKVYRLMHFSSKPKLCMSFDGPGRGQLHLKRLGLGPTPATDDLAALVLDRLTLQGLPSRRFYAAGGAWNIALPAEGIHAETNLAI